MPSWLRSVLRLRKKRIGGSTGPEEQGQISVMCDCGAVKFTTCENPNAPDDEVYQCTVCKRVIRVKIVFEEREVEFIP